MYWKGKEVKNYEMEVRVVEDALEWRGYESGTIELDGGTGEPEMLLSTHFLLSSKAFSRLYMISKGSFERLGHL